MASSGKKLRSGYTTGACAAAAAKAATLLLLQGQGFDRHSLEVEIPFPDGNRVQFLARLIGISGKGMERVASASVIKDAGDDPDVTNGAEIHASARVVAKDEGAGEIVSIKGGAGVGIVTKPGLSVAVGEAAITRVPRSMIREAVHEALSEGGGKADDTSVEITISVPGGKELAKKTLNARLGIEGGISILGTSGIVRPLSADAWTSTITTSMDVAKALGIPEVVLSVGRVSEKAHMNKYGLAEEAYVMMGDHVEFSLAEAAKHGFEKIHLSAQWAKMLKISMSTPHTHVAHGAMDAQKAVAHLNRIGIPVPEERTFNTAREIYNCIVSNNEAYHPALRAVCAAAKRYAQSMVGTIPVIAHLVSYEGVILTDSEETVRNRHRL